MDYFLTKKKLNELQKELEGLKTEGRKTVAEDLKTAKELGDLSENAEYIEARERQQRVEKRIAELGQTVRNAVVISRHTKKRNEVDVGSTVEAMHEGKKVTFFVVGKSEASPEKGFISNESPLGRAVVGCKEGEVVSFKTPRGKSEYKIKKIS